MKKTKKSICAVLCIAGIVCGAAGIAACGGHEHSFGTDWKADGASHWHECTGEDCEEKDSLANHTFGEWAGDSRTCTVCNYTETREHTHTYAGEWKKDATGHWHECACGAKETKQKHDDEIKTSEEATCIKEGSVTYVCKDCGYEHTDEVEKADHSYSETYSYDSDGLNHYFECETEGCNSKSGVERHTIKETVTKPATIETSGLKTEECKVCGYKKENIVIPKLESKTYTVNVRDANNNPLEGITVKLGEYTAETNTQGVAGVLAAKDGYTVVLEGLDTGYIYDNGYAIEADADETTLWATVPTNAPVNPDRVSVAASAQVYGVTITAVMDSEGLGYSPIERYFKLVGGENASKYTVTLLSSSAVIDSTEAGISMLTEKGERFSVVLEAGESSIFNISAYADTVDENFSRNVFLRIEEDAAPEAGCFERPIRADIGEEGKTVENLEEKVYFRLSHEQFGRLVSLEYADGVAVYALGLSKSGEPVAIEDVLEKELEGKVLRLPQYEGLYYYICAASEAGECKITFAKAYEDGMREKPFDAQTGGGENAVTFDTDNSVYEQWYKVSVSAGGNYVITTSSLTSVITIYDNVNGAQVARSGAGSAVLVPMTADVPVYIRATDINNSDYTFEFEELSEKHAGLAAGYPIEATIGENKVNFVDGWDGIKTYYKYTVDTNSKITINYTVNDTEKLTYFLFKDENYEADSMSGLVTKNDEWTEPYTYIVKANTTLYFIMIGAGEGNNNFAFDCEELTAHPYEITVTLPDGTPVTEGVTVKLYDGQTEVASSEFAEGKASFNVIPADFKVALEGLPEGYGYYPTDVIIPLNGDALTQFNVKLTAVSDYSFTVNVPTESGVAGLAGVKVTFTNSVAGEYTAVTDGQGKATVTALPPMYVRPDGTVVDQSYTVTFTSPEGYVLVDTNPIYLTKTNNAKEIILAPYVYTISFEDSERNSIGNVSFKVSDVYGTSVTGTTDSEGKAELSNRLVGDSLRVNCVSGIDSSLTLNVTVVGTNIKVIAEPIKSDGFTGIHNCKTEGNEEELTVVSDGTYIFSTTWINGGDGGIDLVYVNGRSVNSKPSVFTWIDNTNFAECSVVLKAGEKVKVGFYNYKGEEGHTFTIVKAN